MSQTGTLVTWSEAFGAEPTIQMMRDSLAPYSLKAALLGLSRLAALLRTWQNAPNIPLDRTMARDFLPSHWPRIRAIYDTPGDHLTFSRMTLLFVAKQVLLSCEENGADIISPKDVEQLLSCCLMANDLLLGRRPANDDTLLQKVANIFPFTDYISQDTYPLDLPRSLHLMEVTAPQLAHRREYIDLAGYFEKGCGLTVRQFCELAFCASVKFITDVNLQLTGPGGLILTPRFFRQTNIPLGQINSFLRGQSITVANVKADVRRRAESNNDFTLFQRHPLIEFDDGAYLCVDPGFPIDKAGRSLIWVLHAMTPSRKDRGSLLEYWGHLVERYVCDLFSGTYQGRGNFVADPRFSDDSQAGDAWLLEGSHLMVVEVKANTLSVRSKYSFDADTLKAELDRKTSTEEGGSTKGAAQLHRVVERILASEPINGLGSPIITKIFPVLMFLDPSFVTPGLNQYYQEAFDRASLPRRRGCSVTPLFSVTVPDIEQILPYTYSVPLSAILEDFWSHNRKMAGRLSQGYVPLVQRAKRGADPIGDEFHALGRSLERFFDKAAEQPQSRATE